jgi:UDP-glucose:(heptosyl)LPS alpha-1,3-glucosyltransferase
MSRIAFVAEHVRPTCGTGRVVLETARRLAAHHDVHIVSIICEGFEEGEVTWHPVRMPRLPARARMPAFRWLSWRACRDKGFHVAVGQGRSTLRPDAVVMHMCYGARNRRMRNLSPSCARPSALRRAIDWRWSRGGARAEAQLCRRLRGRVIAVSQGLKNDLVESYGLTDEDVVVVPNGVDLDEFTPANREKWREETRARLGIPMEAPVLLFVGGDWFRKGVDHIVGALAKLQDVDARLLLVGEGGEDVLAYSGVYEEVRSRVIRCGTSGNVARLYAAADLFAFPSYYEAFPLVALEAVASGLPLLGSRINGVEELLEDGVEGYFVEFDADDIAAKARRLIEDPSLRTAMGQAARAKAARYTWDHTAERFLEVLGRMGV